MIYLDDIIIVEGKYDKIRLESLIEATIITTEGFGIFKDREKQRFLRRLSEKYDIIILTDSDGAGFLIRNFLSGIIAPEKLKHAYIPDILGKEKRKENFSKEGKIGVEGMESNILLAALRHAGVKCCENNRDYNVGKKGKVTRIMLFEDGLSGGEGSRERRRELLRLLGLPERMSSNAMLAAINALITPDEYRNYVNQIQSI